jgi:hypothetical protein
MLGGFLSETHVISSNDVAAVADELKSELGPAKRDAGTMADASGTAADRSQMTDLDLEDDQEPVVAPIDSSGTDDMSDRVERLEKTLGMVLHMLRRMIRVIEPLAKHGTEAKS